MWHFFKYSPFIIFYKKSLDLYRWYVQLQPFLHARDFVLKYKKLLGSVVFRRRSLSHCCLRMRRRALIQQRRRVNYQRQMHVQQKYWIIFLKKQVKLWLHHQLLLILFSFSLFGCSRSDGDLILVFRQWSNQSDPLQTIWTALHLPHLPACTMKCWVTWGIRPGTIQDSSSFLWSLCSVFWAEPVIVALQLQ